MGGIFKRPVVDGDVRRIREASSTLAHRGPDAAATVVVPGGRAVLAFRRLVVIDRATGDQPMAAPDGHHLVFNGEIYNYRAVREALQRRGAAFRTHSDTEVLLTSLIRDGAAGLEPLRGMFAFALVAPGGTQALLGRDRLGIKPLYYADTAQGLFFASEPKALLALPWVAGDLDATQLPAFFQFRSVPSPRTLFRGIDRLPAGCVLAYDAMTGALTVRRYWEPPAAPAPVPLRHAVDRLEAGLLEAVRRRLVADVPVGAFLSGGLDSALVVAAMRRLGHPEIRTFTATFPGDPDDEAGLARRVSRRFGTEHHECVVAPEAFLASLSTWTDLNDDLVADASSIAMLRVSAAAREAGLVVMLSGEGSDELFGGYGSYHKFLALRRAASLLPAAGLRRGVAALAGRAHLVRPEDRPRVAEYFVRAGDFLGPAALLAPGDLPSLIDPVLVAAAPELPRAPGRRLGDLSRFDLRHRIPDDLLVRTDRATMGASIEGRVPFLDHDLVELALALPAAARAWPGLSKTGLRLVARRWGVPLATIAHRKVGFQLPLGAWFRGPLRPAWRTVLRERVVPGLRYDHVATLVDAHERGGAGYEELLWRILALESWYRRWATGAGGVPLAIRDRRGRSLAAGRP